MRKRAINWNETTLGELALTEENVLLGAAVRRMHGDTLLWAGTCPQTAELSRNCMIRSRLFAAAEPPCAPSEELSVFRSTLEEIPLRNGCIDGVVLHHALEQCTDPRAALREVARVLQPGGQLVICAYNRFGTWSLGRWLGATPDCYLNPWRTVDWLEVLGFEAMMPTSFSLFRPPVLAPSFDAPVFDAPREWGRRFRLGIGNIFVVHMRKRSVTMRPTWNLRGMPARKLAGAGFPKLAAQQQMIAVRRKQQREAT